MVARERLTPKISPTKIEKVNTGSREMVVAGCHQRIVQKPDMLPEVISRMQHAATSLRRNHFVAAALLFISRLVMSLMFILPCYRCVGPVYVVLTGLVVISYGLLGLVYRKVSSNRHRHLEMTRWLMGQAVLPRAQQRVHVKLQAMILDNLEPCNCANTAK